MAKAKTKKTYTEEEIKILKEDLYTGTMVCGGKERVYREYLTETNAKKRVDFLKHEYGTGGHSGHGEYFRHLTVNYDSKGIELYYSDNKDSTLFSWAEVDKIYPEVLFDKEKKYMTTLYTHKDGLFILPVPYGDIQVQGLKGWELNAYNRLINDTKTLYPVIQKCMDKNNKDYSFEQLYGKYQRINVNNEGKLQVALVYCYDKDGNFNVDKYNNAINKLSTNYKDMVIRVPADVGGYSSSMIKYYYGVSSKEDMQKIYDNQKDNDKISLFHECWTTGTLYKEDYRDILKLDTSYEMGREIKPIVKDKEEDELEDEMER